MSDIQNNEARNNEDYQEVYVLEGCKTDDGNYRYPDTVYPLPSAEAHRLVGEGLAVPVSFPSLDAVKRAADNVFEQYKKEREKLRTTPRYNDTPSERAYLLEELEKRIDADMNHLRQQYADEVEKLLEDAAMASLKDVPENDTVVAKLVEHTVSELTYTDDKQRVLELLALKIRVMSENQRLTVLRRFGQLSRAVLDGVTDIEADKLTGALDAIKSQLKLSLPKHELALMQLKQLRVRGNVSSKYDTHLLLRKKNNKKG
jgi:hypothetical protein